MRVRKAMQGRTVKVSCHFILGSIPVVLVSSTHKATLKNAHHCSKTKSRRCGLRRVFRPKNRSAMRRCVYPKIIYGYFPFSILQIAHACIKHCGMNDCGIALNRTGDDEPVLRPPLS